MCETGSMVIMFILSITFWEWVSVKSMVFIAVPFAGSIVMVAVVFSAFVNTNEDNPHEEESISWNDHEGFSSN